MCIVFCAIYVAISRSHTLMYVVVLHTVEFQKRGLPHAHNIVWVSADTSQPTSMYIDSFVSAEIPDPKEDPLGYALVAEQMVHGPCGRYNMSCPCMKNNRCSKRFPKPYQDATLVNENGFAVYRRRANNMFVSKGGKRQDNSWVVPYNLSLLKRYQAHINVEWCNKSIFVKYLFKYVTKGLDCSRVYLQRIRDGVDPPMIKRVKLLMRLRNIWIAGIYVSKMHVGESLAMISIDTIHL